MEEGLHPDEGDVVEQVVRLTDGVGADGVIVTAASKSDAVVSQAFRMCRRKGRVVLVGDVGLHLRRADLYAKEIDLFISTSYGPGRYDGRYEEAGIDYPIAYVRWTENRNMSEYLRLLAAQHVRVSPLISARYPIDDAGAAYESLTASATQPMLVLLQYADGDVELDRAIPMARVVSATSGRIRLAVVGAGGFARSVHLPNLKALTHRFALHAVVTRSGNGAATIAKQFGAAYASTDFEAVLADPEVDAVIIATRHHLHTEMALAALRAGKHVLVEKPLALSSEHLRTLDEYVQSTAENAIPVLVTGYNRRFSPYARRMATLLDNRSNPFILNYRMNAAYVPSEHWVHGPEGGGRNLGEACHIYDLMTYLTGAKVLSVAAHSITPRSKHYGRTDNFVCTVAFADGSVTSLTYTAMGNRERAKESADLYFDGKIITLLDYQSLAAYGVKGRSLTTSAQQKGFTEELTAFADAINTGTWPIPWWQQKQAVEIALRVEDQLVGTSHT
jgi:predicted dehydrogenase